MNFIKSYKPLVLFLCEVHSYEEDLLKFKQSFKFLNYSLYTNCILNNNSSLFLSAKRRKSIPKGGICALIIDHCPLIKVENVLDHRCIKVTLNISNHIMDIFGVYAPSCCEALEDRSNWWNDFADKIDSSQNEIIILGDLNIHLIEDLDHNNENNCPELEGVDRILMKVYDIWRTYNPSMHKYTFNKGNLYSRIDYVLITPDLEEFFDSFYLPFDVTIS